MLYVLAFSPLLCQIRKRAMRCCYGIGLLRFDHDLYAGLE